MLFTTEHNTYNRRRDISWFKRIDRVIYKQYNCIISISQKANENLINHIGNDFPCKVIQNGIDLSRFNTKIVAPPLNGDVIISMVAGFRPQKDQDTLIKAISRLPKNYKLWLVGDGERREDIERLIALLRLSDRVKLWGIRNDIPDLLAQTHIVVLSSHWEGFGLAAVEGMASGKPVIVSNIEGLRDVVNGAGILFPHKDYLALAKEIKSLCEAPDQYKAIAQRCQERARRYTIEEMAKLYNEIYLNKKI